MRPVCRLLCLAAIASALLPAGTAWGLPFAGFTYEPRNPLTHETVRFTSAATTDAGATIVSEEWDLDDDGGFDDGSGPTARFTYGRPGPRQVALRVVDSAGNGDTHRERLVVGNRAPLVSFFPVPAEQGPGGLVTLHSTSSDPDGFIVSHGWDLDADGQFDDGGGNTAVLTVPASGAYTVALRVTDDSGASSTLNFAAGNRTGTNSLGSGSFFRLMSPFPVVRISGVVRKRGIKLRLISISAPIGATISVRCRGRGCVFRKRATTLSARPHSGARLAPGTGMVRIRRLGRRVLRVGAAVQVFVTTPNAIGKYTRLRVRRGGPPARIDQCAHPGSETPAPCPTG